MQQGNQLAAAMWAMTALSFILVGLRLYTRIYIVQFVGVEDHLYFWTAVFLAVFTSAIQVSVHYGLGRDFWSLNVSDSSNAIFWSYVANTFAITGNALAKLSMGFFLLRVVRLRWHKIALWCLIFITASTSAALAIMLWNQTTPVKASWDPFRTPGRWKIRIQPMSVGLGVWSSICDFFFAAFPWLFIWTLHMPRREKFMLATGMSLGVIAGACGIVRTVVLSRLNVLNYTLNFARYFGWAAGEITMSMVCLGIPTLRPLYLKCRGLLTNITNHRDTIGDNASSAPENSAGPRCGTLPVTMTSVSVDSMPMQPPSVHLSKEKNDSSEDLRSTHSSSGRICVRNETKVQWTTAPWPLKE